MNIEIPQLCEYPHLHKFLVYESRKAYKKKEERELLEEFGRIEDD